MNTQMAEIINTEIRLVHERNPFYTGFQMAERHALLLAFTNAIVWC